MSSTSHSFRVRIPRSAKLGTRLDCVIGHILCGREQAEAHSVSFRKARADIPPPAWWAKLTVRLTDKLYIFIYYTAFLEMLFNLLIRDATSKRIKIVLFAKVGLFWRSARHPLVVLFRRSPETACCYNRNMSYLDLARTRVMHNDVFLR